MIYLSKMIVYISFGNKRMPQPGFEPESQPVFAEDIQESQILRIERAV